MSEKEKIKLAAKKVAQNQKFLDIIVRNPDLDSGFAQLIIDTHRNLLESTRLEVLKELDEKVGSVRDVVVEPKNARLFGAGW